MRYLTARPAGSTVIVLTGRSIRFIDAALTRSPLGVGLGEGAAGSDPDGRPVRHRRFR